LVYKQRVLYRFGRALTRYLFCVHFRATAQGRDRVPREGGLLILANHTSFADPCLVAWALPRPTDFMAMAELFRHSVVAWLLRRVHAFPVNRSQVDQRAVREAVRRLRDGHAVTLFPEGGIRQGERSVLGGQPDLKPGAVVIAELGNSPLLPVVLRNTRSTYDWRNWFRRPAITVTFGYPFCLWLPPSTRGRARRALAQEILRQQLLATTQL
jgi:1-acyl-sn-glycerol-3-phosphate acyltransferase